MALAAWRTWPLMSDPAISLVNLGRLDYATALGLQQQVCTLRQQGQIGDVVAGLPQLAHVAAMAGMVVAAKLAGKRAKPVRRDRIPACTYCEPQIGSVGLTEAQARAQGYQVKVGKFPFSANSKASIVGAHEGFVKVVADAKYGELLGVHIIGPQATEMIAESVVALELEATIEELMFAIHAHPTLAEAMLDGFGSIENMAINV